MTDQVTLRIPAQSRFAATTRVTLASVAAELGFSIDAIEEFRVGVNELAAVLIEWAEDHGCDEIELACTATEASIEVRGVVVGAAAASAPPEGEATSTLDVLTAQILDGVVDEHALDGPSGRIVKRRSPL